MSGAWIGVIGTLSGVIAGGGIAGGLDVLRWRREDRTRWHDERRALYGKALAAADETQETINQIVEAAALEDDYQAVFARAHDMAEQLRRLIVEIELVAEDDVKTAVVRLHRALRALLLIHFRLASKWDTIDGLRDDLAVALHEYLEALAAFKAAARAEIGVDRAK